MSCNAEINKQTRINMTIETNKLKHSVGQHTVRQQLWASCYHPCASVTKQYNLVPAKGRWCFAAGKVTIGLASPWPCGTDFSGLSTYGLNGHQEHPIYAPTGASSTLSLQCGHWPFKTSFRSHNSKESVLQYCSDIRTTVNAQSQKGASWLVSAMLWQCWLGNIRYCINSKMFSHVAEA